MFKPQSLLWGLIPGTALCLITPSAIAQCVVADVSIQAAIDGSDAPAEQVNDVTVDVPDRCVGNTSVHTNRQVHVGGTDTVRQGRQSHHQINRSQEQNQGPSGQGPTVVVPVGVQVDVDNPAARLRW